MRRIAEVVYWKGMKKNVREFVRECQTCQANKYETVASPGLLQPLPIPQTVWSEISLDFIEGLPRSHGKDVILVVVDRLSKYAHFIPLTHPYTALKVAQQFLDHIYKLHGVPTSMVTDRDNIFQSQFWKELFTMLRTKLKYSTAYHPQTDGQTEVVNQTLETYLRCMTGERPKDWLRWLALAEYWYNTTFHTSAQTTPYQVVYGQPPPIHRPYMTGDTSIEMVDRSFQHREAAIQLLKFHLARAQQRMKIQADKGRTERIFHEGDMVYLKLQPYRQKTVVNRINLKLAAKYFGPFEVIARIGQVSYKVKLPENARIHPVFHVSQLKKHVGNAAIQSELPVLDDDGLIAKEP